MGNPAELYELSSKINGARILFSSDDFFGVAENLLQVTEPDIDTDKTTCRLSYQDAWITRRKRLQNCDFVIIQLAVRAEIRIICVDTANLFNNAAIKFSVQATNLSTTDHDCPEFYQNRSNRVGGHTTDEEWSNINQLRSEIWPYLISWQPLNPGYPSMNKKLFMIPSAGQEYTHLRLNIYPDGGISRLHVYGKVSRPMPSLWDSRIDLVSEIYGGKCIAYSNCYNNSHPNNLIKPIFSQDGWQTARSLIRSIEGFPHNNSPSNFNQIIGEEWAIFKLGYSGKIVSIELDTTGFKGDSPYIVRMQGLREGIMLIENDINNTPWQDIIPYTLVNEGSKQEITVQDQNMKMAYVKLSIKPDGCVTGFRVLGEI